MSAKSKTLKQVFDFDMAALAIKSGWDTNKAAQQLGKLGGSAGTKCQMDARRKNLAKAITKQARAKAWATRRRNKLTEVNAGMTGRK